MLKTKPILCQTNIVNLFTIENSIDDFKVIFVQLLVVPMRLFSKLIFVQFFVLLSLNGKFLE